jgi:hypothetical protein
MIQIDQSFPLTALRLRFTCAAETTLHLGGLRAGSNLRGALVNVMRRATCAKKYRSSKCFDDRWKEKFFRVRVCKEKYRR